MSAKNNASFDVILTKRCGRINPGSIDDYIGAGGYKALEKALKMTPLQIVEEVKASNLKGRGGAGFPTGLKMESVLKAGDFPKYLVCNADEGEPGNFKDKYLMEKDPHQLIEGMITAAFCVGASKGYIYIRGEYDESTKIIGAALEQARLKGFIGKNILGTGFDFDMEIKSGAGAYVCGEEYSLIESIEGNPGRSRNKPPYPTGAGLYNKPTLLNNVETFSNLPFIILNGAEKFTSIGTPSSSGTKLISLSGNVRKRGVYEIPFGMTVREIIDDLGGGVAENRKIKMVQLGGASGPCLPESMLDVKVDYKELASKGLSIGSGAIIVIDDRSDIMEILELIVKFFEHESCGKCTPCREGTRQLSRIIERFASGTAAERDLALLQPLIDTMCQTSLCGLGQAAPTALITTLKYFNDEYTSRINACD